MRFFSTWKLPRKDKRELFYNEIIIILKSKYVKSEVEVRLRRDRLLFVTFQETINRILEENCIKIERLWTEGDDPWVYGIKVYVVEYQYILFEKVRTYTISFSEQYKCDVNLLHGPKNSKNSK